MPRQLAEKAATGKVLAGLLPSVALFRQENTFERLGHFGIAVRGRARSALLFSTKPIRQLEGATIAITEETSTTVCLLRLLLEQRYQVIPAAYDRVRVPPLLAGVDEGVPPVPSGGEGTPKAEGWSGQAPKADALLLIGDEALRFKQTDTQYPFEIDVGFEWWLWQHVPFVFAVWAIRKDASPQDKKQIELGLARSLSTNLTQLDAIAQEQASGFGIPAEELETYLSGFVYRLGQDEEQGIKRFRELINEHHLL